MKSLDHFTRGPERREPSLMPSNWHLGFHIHDNWLLSLSTPTNPLPSSWLSFWLHFTKNRKMLLDCKLQDNSTNVSWENLCIRIFKSEPSCGGWLVFFLTQQLHTFPPNGQASCWAEEENGGTGNLWQLTSSWCSVESTPLGVSWRVLPKRINEERTHFECGRPNQSLGAQMEQSREKTEPWFFLFVFWPS